MTARPSTPDDNKRPTFRAMTENKKTDVILGWIQLGCPNSDISGPRRPFADHLRTTYPRKSQATQRIT